MIPILYSENETAFASNGIGRLSDYISATCKQGLNGEFEIELIYPDTGVHSTEIKERRYILAKPDEVSTPQAFEVYKVTKSASGRRLTVNAHHITYKLNGMPVAPFTATGIQPALNGLVSNTLVTNPFTVWTDITNDTTPFANTVPHSFRALLGGIEGSIIDAFNAEIEWNMYTVKAYARRGADNGVQIRYGKNLTEFKNERSSETFYTGCIAYWASEDETITGDVQYIPNHTDYTNEKIYILDVSQDYQEQPNTDTLNNAAANYATAHNFGREYADTLQVSFVQLWQTEEYKNIAPLERVALGDTVTVVYDGFSVPMRVVEYSYDVINERYKTMVLGTKKATLQQTIAQPIETTINRNISQAVSNLENAILQATDLIRGGLGGNIVINTNADGMPNEILIMDTPDINTAVNVLRMNMAGIGYSSTGYNGEYTTAWTLSDGAFNADFIRAGNIDGSLITAASVLANALEVSAYEAVSGSIENITYDGAGMHIARKDPNTGTIVSEYQSLFTELGMRVMDSNGVVTLSAEQDTVDAVNLSAHQYFRIVDDDNATNSRFQGFYNSIHQTVQHGIFWEK